MSTLVYLSTLGRPVGPDEARVSVFDRGFLFGDDVFETMRTAGGRPLEIDRHLARLTRSADAIGLSLPWSESELRAVIDETHRASGNDESYVRMVVTRGTGPLRLDPRTADDPTLVVIVQPLRLPSAQRYARGLAAMIVEMTTTGSGLDPTIKSGNYLGNIQALRRAIAHGAEDAILCNAAGRIAEGATSNVFMVAAGVVVTPPVTAGLLPGITRGVVCELGRELGLVLEEQPILPDELRRAEEVFLTSSVRAIMPVTRLDGREVGAGVEGATTRRLRERYERYVEAASA